MKRFAIFCALSVMPVVSARAAVLFSDDFTNAISSSRLVNDAFQGGVASSSYWATSPSASGVSLTSNQAGNSALKFFATGAAGSTSVIDQVNHDAIDANQDIFNSNGGLRYSFRGLVSDVQLGSTTAGNVSNTLDFGILSSNSTLTSANDKVALRLRTTANVASAGVLTYTFVVGQTEPTASGSGGDVFAGKTTTTLAFAPTGFDFDVTPTGYNLAFYNGDTVGSQTSGTWATAMTAAAWGNGVTTAGSIMRLQNSRTAVSGVASADSSATQLIGSIVVSDVPEPTTAVVSLAAAGRLLARKRRHD